MPGTRVQESRSGPGLEGRGVLESPSESISDINSRGVGLYTPIRKFVANQACYCLLGAFTLPQCICEDARAGTLGVCGSGAQVHGQRRSSQFWNYRN